MSADRETASVTRAGDTVARSGLLLVGVLLIGANLRASITAVGPVLGDIRHDLGIGGATASILISLPLVGFALISPLAPAVARRIGIEKSLGASLLLLAVGIVGRSIPVAGAIWIGTALLGVAIAMINVLLPALIKRDYPDRIGALTGWYSAAQSGLAALGAGLAVPIAGLSPAGWRLSLGVWAGLALIALGVFLPQLRSRSIPDEETDAVAGPAGSHGRAEHAGRDTDADPAGPDATAAAAHATTGAPDASAVGRTAASRRADTGATTLPAPPRAGGMWGSALAWHVTLFLGLQSTVYYTVITWWPSIEAGEGVSQAVAGWHQFGFQMLGIAGTLLAGALIGRMRDQRLLIAIMSGVALLALLGQIVLPDLSLLWVLLIGATRGGSIVVGLSLFGLRTRNHQRAASLSGMAQSVGYLLAAAGPIVLGMLHDATGLWQLPLAVLAAVAAGELVFGVLAGRDRYVGPA